jgi:hypothetical protein
MERLKHGVPATQTASRARLDSESWSAKARQFEDWLN